MGDTANALTKKTKSKNTFFLNNGKKKENIKQVF
jgi:hypothetical protein